MGALRRALDLEPPLELGDREHLDSRSRALRHLAGKLERLVAALALDDVEPSDRFLRLRERPVRDERLLAGTDDRRRLAAFERLAQDVGAALCAASAA